MQSRVNEGKRPCDFTVKWLLEEIFQEHVNIVGQFCMHAMHTKPIGSLGKWREGRLCPGCAIQ
jgi:hypothetical protein